MESGGVERESSGIVPSSVMEAVKRTSNNIDDLGTNFSKFLSLCDTDVLAELEPLKRAHSLLIIAKANTTLFALKLRCNGVNIDDHPIKSELERLNLYQEKLQRCIELSKAPLRPSTTLNYQAATRFIEHSLPDLTPEQRKSLREISKGEEAKNNYLERNIQKKRKYQSPEKQSVQMSAQKFLEKAAQELLGHNKTGIKGPLQADDSDECDELMD